MTEAVARDGVWRRRRLARSLLYLCADRRAGQGDLAGFLDAVLGAGVDLVQLRDKTAARDELVAAGELMRAAAGRHGALFIVNDHPGLAVELDADGVHVGQDDAPVEAARAAVGAERLVGLSTHSPEQVDRALTRDCDYFSVGPVHPTPTKHGRPGIGLAPLRHAAAVAGDRPWFVTGGMSASTAGEVLTTGARRLVAVRALTGAEDPARAAGELAAVLRAAGDRPGS